MYSPILFGICLKYARTKMEAEDNLHDSFITIFEKMGQYGGKGSLEGWLKRVTVNTILQKFRKEDFLSIVSENTEEAVDVDGPWENIDMATLLNHIQELPNKYRATFNLYVLDGYSHKEIGELLGTSAGTSKSNLARAKSILKEKIETSITRSIIGVLIIAFGYIL